MVDLIEAEGEDAASLPHLRNELRVAEKMNVTALASADAQYAKSVRKSKS
jgi:hypothetical protein